MKTKIHGAIASWSIVLAVVLGTVWQAKAQDAKGPYPRMAPLDQYLIADQNAEIEFARSAAPDSVSRDAEVLVLDRQGYKTAVKGTNGFVCMVQRSWAAGIDDPDFWNPKLRAPICLNAPAVRTFLPFLIKRTELVLAGRSKDQMFAAIEAAIDKKELPMQEIGAMSYMMSKQGYLNDRAGHWHPHLMFFVPLTEPAVWGAGLPGSPVVAAFFDTPERLTVFLVPVGEWSDGTAASMSEHP